MKVLVLFESNTGNTRTVAESIGGAARAAGAEVNVRSVRHIDLHELSTADVVFLGTWVDGLILFGHRPGGGWRFAGLPALDQKRVALFCTYAVHGSQGMLKGFTKMLARKGAVVVARQGFKRGHLDDGIMQFVADTFAEVPVAN